MNDKTQNVAQEVRSIFTSGYYTPKRTAKKILQAIYDKNNMNGARAKTTDLRWLDVPYSEERILDRSGEKPKVTVYIKCQ